jgi:S-adenosylmethionine:tRNA ribosyltransferase-isomerase
MRAATTPVQRPGDARLLAIDAGGGLRELPRSRLAGLFRPGDLLVANDAATLPASLTGVHAPSGASIEVRLAGRPSLAAADVGRFTAIVFGAGDHRTPTERRIEPPPMQPGDLLRLGPLTATVRRVFEQRRRIELGFDAPADAVWAGIAAHGRPIQYAHIAEPLALWDVWTAVAARPVAFEPPSAGFVLDWSLLDTLRRRGVGFGTLTHAAGLSSTGDAALDALLPFDEAYELPAATVAAIAAAKDGGHRIVALGTTVARALEHAASRPGPLRAGPGVATQRLGPDSVLRVVDAIVSGTHEAGTSHHELLRAFADDAVLARADRLLEQRGYRTHEFGDSVWIERAADRAQPRSNLNTATLASRFGQRRTTAPFWIPNESRMRKPSRRASTSKST